MPEKYAIIARMPVAVDGPLMHCVDGLARLAKARAVWARIAEVRRERQQRRSEQMVRGEAIDLRSERHGHQKKTA